MAVTIKVDIDKIRACKRICSDEAKLFLAATAYKLMFDYVPADSLTLASTVYVDGGSKMSEQAALSKGLNSDNIKIEDNQAVIHFNVPYAHRNYTGYGFNFRKDIHRLATAKWDKAMLLSRKEKLQKTMQNYYDTEEYNHER